MPEELQLTDDERLLLACFRRCTQKARKAVLALAYTSAPGPICRRPQAIPVVRGREKRVGQRLK